ncbi:MAG: hypothetical protein HGB31_06285 [Erysipelotrichaceae bacterium]|nr:hypothetical protein [Erysipelotrichaceae bacterium]
MKHKKTKGLKGLLLNYLKVFSGILLVVLIIGYIYLLDYQTSLPSDAGTRVIKAIENLDLDTLDEMSSNLPISLTNPDIFTEYLKVFSEEPDLYFYAGTSKVENQDVYIIGNHDKMMATLILEKTGKKSLFGFDKFKVVDLVFKPLHEFKIIAPSGVKLLLNGVSIDDQVQDLKTIQIPAFTQEVFGTIETLTYTFKNFQFISSVTIDGQEAEVVYDPLTYTYSVVYRPTQSIQDELSTFGINAMKAHTRLLGVPYLSRSAFLSDYAYPGSHIVSLVNSYDLSVRYPLISESFSDLKAENFIQYGPNAYSADVTLSYTLTSTWFGVVKTRVMTPYYKVYMTNIDGAWHLTDLVILTSN